MASVLGDFMKSVLIAIQPYWAFLIIAKKMGWEIDQEKTVEVRKSFPKDLDWNKKSIIYCGKNKQSFNRIPKKYQPLMEKFLGKVIGEFVCDKIHDIALKREFETGYEYWECGYFAEEDCLSMEEFEGYLKKGFGYGWHITDLVIYETPKELSEFYRECEEYRCDNCPYLYVENTPNCYETYCEVYGKIPIKRPPQSWCYVEEMGV